MITTKTCASCRQDLPVAEFNKDRSHSDGLKSRCKRCRAKDRRRANGHRSAAPDSGADRKRQATTEAITELIRRHQSEFQMLLAAAKRRNGLTPEQKWRSFNGVFSG